MLAISVASFTFSYLFEPFEVNRSEHKLDYFWICLIHATIPFILGLTYFSCLRFIQKTEQKWTLGKEALHLSILLFLIGLSSYFARAIIYTSPDNMSFGYVLEELKNTFLVGILLLAIILPLNLDRLIKKYQLAAKTIEVSDIEVPLKKATITIHTALISESFNMDITAFVYAKVDGNYSDIFTLYDLSIEKKMLRTPLKELELQLQKYPHIIRTHRSYLVNTQHIQSVTGNAQGYLLKLTHVSDEIPVSRAQIAHFNAHFSTQNV
ncbi:MAG: hypothetical protein ACJARZ_002355 [Dokdonia sp.]